MQTKPRTSDIEKVSPCEHADDASLGDIRFRALLSADEWNRLPGRVRKRFSKRLAGGATAIYVGEAKSTNFSRLGWYLAQLARLIGGPLPTATYENVPSIVTVTEDIRTGGQVWTRLYAGRNGFPQVIHSSKCFTGPTGLEEFIGFGFSMALKVIADDRSLIFESADYFWQMGSRRFRLPAWATPGALTVKHIDKDDGTFLFSLEIRHRRFGLLVEQVASFREATP